jgi:hypothetical protein
MQTIPQRLFAAVAVFAMALALFNHQIAAGLVAAGAMVAWTAATVVAARRADQD